METKKIQLDGEYRPEIWEEGGGHTNTGFARIICGPEGQKVPAARIKRSGHLANGKHACYPVRTGMVIIEVERHGDDYTTKMWRIISVDHPIAEVVLIGHLEDGEWKVTPPAGKNFERAFEAALDKSECYHCREPHYTHEQYAVGINPPVA